MQAQNQVFRTPFESFKNIIRNEGILALWKGAIPAASTGLIENFVVFTANGLLRKLFVRQDEVMCIFGINNSSIIDNVI